MAYEVRDCIEMLTEIVTSSLLIDNHSNLYRGRTINYKTTLLGIDDSVKGINVNSRNVFITVYIPIHSKLT